MILKLKYSIILPLTIFLIAGCSKSDFLAAKPDEKLIVPHTIEDYQAILDNDGIMNGASNFGLLPALGEAGTDNFFITDTRLNTLTPLSRNIYSWQKDVFAGEEILDWDFPYRAVFYSNVVLEGIDKISATTQTKQALDNLRGSALFFRAMMFYELAQVFAPYYDITSTTANWGIPLRLQSDVGEIINRATLKETYNRIITDLLEAKTLLPETPLYKTRPSISAVNALLSRLYLSIADYDNAFLYANLALQHQNSLLDYNSINNSNSFSIPQFNTEVIFSCNLTKSTVQLLFEGVASLDSLAKQYDRSDLRKSIFFKDLGTNSLSFAGSYDGSTILFGGLATDEMYLNRAECYARKGKVTEALYDLNSLLIRRWKTGTFVQLTAIDKNEVLQIILKERRKELVFRGIRWTDLRRLNHEGIFPVTLQKTVNGLSYTLPPNDPKYVYPIPDKVISFNPSMPQNIRQ